MSREDESGGYVPGYPVARRRRATAGDESRSARETAVAIAGVYILGAVLAWLVVALCGCSAVVNVPPSIANGVAVVDSNVNWLDRRYSKALAELGRGALEKKPEEDDADEHDRVLMAATEELLASLKLWMSQHRERTQEGK